MTAQLARVPSLMLRRAMGSDQAAIERMHARCSSTSRRYRWRAPLVDIPQTYLRDALTGRPGHVCLVAVDGEDVVGFASAVEEENRTWQIGVLVRDDRQRQGIGTALVTALIECVEAAGGRAMVAETAADRLALLERLGRARPLFVRRTADGLRGEISLSASTSS